MRTILLFVWLRLTGWWADIEPLTWQRAWQRAKAMSAAKTPGAKPWWMSKTLWLNTLVGMLLVAEANIGTLQGYLPESKYKIVAFVLPILNFWLRAITTQGLSFKPQMPQGAQEGK